MTAVDLTIAAAVAAGASLDDPNLGRIGKTVLGADGMYQYQLVEGKILAVRVQEDSQFVTLCASRGERTIVGPGKKVS